MKRKGMSHSEAGKLGYKKAKKKLLIFRKKQVESSKKKLANKKCLFCKKAIKQKPGEGLNDSLKRKFCGSSCSASFNNVGIRRHNKCKKCGKHFIYIKSLLKHEKSCSGKKCKNCGENTLSLRGKFCGQNCMSEFIVEKGFKEIRKLKGHSSDRMLKNFLLKHSDRSCSICKRKKWRNQPIPLIMDHIDGNSSNKKLSNVRLVCGNCDMQLPTYKNKNKGNGRAYRRVRYAQGKSY